MVYSLAWSPSGKLLVAGLGDGNIPLFAINNRTLVQTGHLQDGHDSSVASVLFPAFGKTNERMVVSGGSDGSVICWDIGTNVMEVSETYNPKDLFAETFIAGTSDDEPMEGLSHQTETLSLGKSTILFGISHNKKVNWMTTSEGAIFVADTSHAISEYKLPIR